MSVRETGIARDLLPEIESRLAFLEEVGLNEQFAIYPTRDPFSATSDYQGVDKLGAGLTVEARAPDGVVEAVSAEVNGAPVLAVPALWMNELPAFMMLPLLFPTSFSDEIVAANYRYYEPLTDHAGRAEHTDLELVCHCAWQSSKSSSQSCYIPAAQCRYWMA